jgi:hypothetical protein
MGSFQFAGLELYFRQMESRMGGLPMWRSACVAIGLDLTFWDWIAPDGLALGMARMECAAGRRALSAAVRSCSLAATSDAQCMSGAAQCRADDAQSAKDGAQYLADDAQSLGDNAQSAW